MYFYITDATLGNLYVKVFNLTWTPELTDNSTYEFLRHANPFCADVSFLIKGKKRTSIKFVFLLSLFNISLHFIVIFF